MSPKELRDRIMQIIDNRVPEESDLLIMALLYVGDAIRDIDTLDVSDALNGIGTEIGSVSSVIADAKKYL